MQLERAEQVVNAIGMQWEQFAKGGLERQKRIREWAEVASARWASCLVAAVSSFRRKRLCAEDTVLELARAVKVARKYGPERRDKHVIAGWNNGQAILPMSRARRRYMRLVNNAARRAVRDKTSVRGHRKKKQL